RITGLGAVTEVAVVAEVVLRRMDAGVGRGTTAVGRAGNPIVAAGWCAGQATEGCAARLAAGAELPVVDGAVLWRMDAGIGRGATAVGRAGNPIVAAGWCAAQAFEACVAGLAAVAELAVVAGAVLRRMDAGIGRGATAVSRAGNPIVAAGWRARLAARGRAAGLGPVTEVAVVAADCGVDAAAGGVAGVGGTGVIGVAAGRRVG